MRKYSFKIIPGFCFIYILLLLLSKPGLAEQGKDLINGKLATCPDTPNCISTENNNVAPINIGEHTPDQAWLILQESIVQLGGKIEIVRADYLWASFQTSVFKFTDDVEARLDSDSHLIHLRSASRKGYYDFNANRNRLKRIMDTFFIRLNPERLKNIRE